VIRVRLRVGAPVTAFSDFDTVIRRGGRKPIALRQVHAGVADQDAGVFSGKRWPGCSEQAVLPLRRLTVAGRRPTEPPPPPERRHGRNSDWRLLDQRRYLTMPDNWEYPWFAAWDLAFHCVASALMILASPAPADPAWAEWYMHPNGQLRLR